MINYFGLFLCVLLIERVDANSKTAPIYPPIRRILQNYEQHLLKLKDKLQSHEAKDRKSREESIEPGNGADDEAVKLVESFDEHRNRKATTEIQRIGILTAPSTQSPTFPSTDRHLKYWTQYARKTALTTTNKTSEKESKEIKNSNDDSEPMLFSSTYRKKTRSESSKKVSNSSTESKESEENEGTTRKLTDGLKMFSLFSASSPPEEPKSEDDKEPNRDKQKPFMQSLAIRRLNTKPVDNQLSLDDDQPFKPELDLYNVETTTESKAILVTTIADDQLKQTTPDVETTTVEVEKMTTTSTPLFSWQRSSFVTASPTETPETLPSLAHVPTLTSTIVYPLKRRSSMAKTRGAVSFTPNQRAEFETQSLEPVDFDREFDFTPRRFGAKRRNYGAWYLKESDGLDYEDEEIESRELDKLVDEDERNYVMLPRNQKFVPYRFGYRRKPISSSYLSDDDFGYFHSHFGFPSRGSHHFPSMVERSRALSLPRGRQMDDEMNSEMQEETNYIHPTPELRFSTIRSGIAGSNVVLPPSEPQHAVAEAPSPEEQKENKILPSPLPSIPSNRSDLLMSKENCGKVGSYAKMFGVKDPQTWVRKNCPFVQTFVNAPCSDINTFVDSCYRFRV
ncbi:hypothetical protein M3Y96_00744600 [Aphelenchoides besseyi]|nr:hypothetical protein M3Y96_00744600 [Aphelenchoides besseyi]